MRFDFIQAYVKRGDILMKLNRSVDFVEFHFSSSSSSRLLQGGPKNPTILNVDNFAMVSGRNACDMSKVCKFCLEKSLKLA